MLRKLLQARPNEIDALHLLGVIEHAGGRDEAALALLERAVAARPRDASFHNNLGAVCKALGRTGDAIEHYRRAVEMDAGYAVAHNGLGAAYLDLDELAKARPHLERALAIDPTLAMAEANLGALLEKSGEPGEALRHHERAIEAAGGSADLPPELSNNLGLSLQSLGRPAEAEQWFRRAVEARASFLTAHSNLLLCMNYGAHDSEAVFAEHLRWAGLHSAAIQQLPPRALSAPDLDPDRRLHVGYVTPDCDGHLVGSRPARWCHSAPSLSIVSRQPAAAPPCLR